MAVKGLDKHDILTVFRDRIVNSVDEEFAAACEQVEKIARLRLEARLPDRLPVRSLSREGFAPFAEVIDMTDDCLRPIPVLN